MMASVAKTTDVVVIGFGFAGGAAAIAAADAGARVLLIEKAPQPGGISVCSAGGLRVADDADAAFAYLDATCGGKTPEPVLRRLAEGMVALPAEIEMLAKKHGATVAQRRAGGNYPLPGFDTFGFVTVEDVPGFDPTAFSHVRGSPAGMRLFKLLAEAVAARRERITVATGRGASRLERGSNDVDAVLLENGERIAARAGIVLACGGFEADTNMQAQYWPGGPALNAAYRHNTGDGIRMAQAVGADLWHMWHYHGAYGFPSPDPAYPYGVRVKRLPDWRPGDGGDVPGMTWILVDRRGRRFMNEYEPYMQDTGWRPFAAFDPVRQDHAHRPVFLLTDAEGLTRYPLGKPTRNDPDADYEWSADNRKEIAGGTIRYAPSVRALAAKIGVDARELASTLRRWNGLCVDGHDEDFGRPSGSLHPLAVPPFYAAEVRPIVSNTQGGPVHDAEQRVLDPFGAPIPGLYAAGECGSAFGHVYLSGGNLAECFVGGGIAGRNAARRLRSHHEHAA